MAPRDALLFDADFEVWAHDGQIAPPGEGWRTWLMMAGRGFGKTRAGAEWISRLAARKAGVRIALVGASIAESRSIMVEGVSGIMSIAQRRRQRVKWESSLGRLRWPNGSQAQLFSGDHADGMRGPEFDFAWCDELAKWREAQRSWDNLQMALRRGPRPRALVTTTPRPLRLLERISEMKWTVTTHGRTSDNINLDEKFIEVMAATYGGTKLGRQELDGELLFDMEGALWPRALLTKSRWAGPHPKFDRIMVGVDPPAGVGEDCDACGIVVAGSAGNDFYVLADESIQGLSPEGWASRVAAVAARWNTAQVVAEANNGGAMVKSVLHAADDGLKVRLVHASLGKAARAEPIALLFEKGRVWLAGEFASLEDELAGIIAGGGYEGPGRSPDRADAMVWALTALSETKSGVPRIRRL
jgi:phage terminase large subunit-like protein